MTTCDGWNYTDDGTDVEFCTAEAEYDRNCDGSSPVCARHKCRCSVTLVEAERRRELQRVPSWWLAL